MTPFWQQRRVLVTGATGLLGSHLTRALLLEGAQVITLERDRVGESLLHQPGFLSRPVTAVRGCLEDYLLLERILVEHEVDVIFHLAAQTIVGIANRNPLSTFEANIRGTYHILEAARRTPTVSRVVMASSDKAYGPLTPLPYQEDGMLAGRHPYDVSKSCADLIAQSYFSSFRLPVCITRCANLFGPGDLNFNRLIPGTLRSIGMETPPIIRSDGTPVRDYLYVLDGVLACLTLAQAMDNPSIHGEAFNFGLEQPLSVLALVKMLLELSGKSELQPHVLGQPLREVPLQYVNAHKARSLLGWTPAYSLEQGLRATMDWYLARESFSPPSSTS